MPFLEQDGIKRRSTADVPTATRLDYFAAALSEAAFPLGVDNADPQTQESNRHPVISVFASLQGFETLDSIRWAMAFNSQSRDRLGIRPRPNAH
jgi:hypothetical protein